MGGKFNCVALTLLLVLVVSTASTDEQVQVCHPLVSGKLFNELVTEKKCDVDQKLLAILQEDPIAYKGQVENFLCIGFIEVFGMAGEDACIWDTLKSFAEEVDLCQDSEMNDTLREANASNAFTDHPAVVTVAKYITDYCPAMCAKGTPSAVLCWAFNEYVKMAIIHHRSDAPATSAPLASSEPSEPTAFTLPPLPPHINSDSSTADAVKESSIDTNNDTAVLNAMYNNPSDEKAPSPSSPQEEEENVVTPDNSTSVGAVDSTPHSEEPANNDVIGTDNDVIDPQGPADNDVIDSPGPDQPSTVDSASDIPLTAESEGDGNNTIEVTSNANDGQVDLDGDHTQSTAAPTPDQGKEDQQLPAEVPPVSSGDYDGTHADDDPYQGDYSNNSDNQGGQSDDKDSQGDDQDSQSDEQDGSYEDDQDDDGTSGYWHIAAILLVVLFLGVVGYFASLNRKKIRESVSTYMSKRKRRKEYKPVSNMEAALS